MTNEYTAAHALGGRFELEACGFFEECSHKVEKYDMTANTNGPIISEVYYCALDWMKVGPLIAISIMILFFVFKKTRGIGAVRRSV